MLDLQTLNGITLGETYFYDKAAIDFIFHIADMYFDNLKSLLKDSKYFSLFCDRSTDRTESEKEIIMVKVLDNFYPRVKYLKLVETENTKAEGILAAIDTAMQTFDHPDYKQKLIGSCSDGASVMMGARRGVIKLLKERGQVEYVLAV